jgi:hypothetical protein
MATTNSGCGASMTVHCTRPAHHVGEHKHECGRPDEYAERMKNAFPDHTLRALVHEGLEMVTHTESWPSAYELADWLSARGVCVRAVEEGR